MTLSQRIANIKNQIKSVFEADLELKLDDGRIVTTNGVDLGVDVEVFLVNEDGTHSMLEDGNYTFEDGTKITLVEGKIKTYGEFAPEAVTEEVTVEMEVVTEIETEVPVDNTKYDELVAKYDELAARLAESEATIVSIMDMIQQIANGNTEMMNKINKLSKAPAVEFKKEPIKETGVLATDSKSSFAEFRKAKHKLNIPGGNTTISK